MPREKILQLISLISELVDAPGSYIEKKASITEACSSRADKINIEEFCSWFA